MVAVVSGQEGESNALEQVHDDLGDSAHHRNRQEPNETGEHHLHCEFFSHGKPP
jgi:hypothetical protein